VSPELWGVLIVAASLALGLAYHWVRDRHYRKLGERAFENVMRSRSEAHRMVRRES
jgi:hypothetical protein